MLISLLLSLAWGSTVVIPEPNSPASEYRAYLAAHADTLTPTQALLRTRPSAAARDQLVSAFSEAQTAFLKDTPDQGRKKFEDLLSKMHDEDWGSIELEVFFTAAMRRAQLARNEGDQNAWIKFAVSAGQGAVPNRGHFPPPLVQLYEATAKVTRKQLLKIAGLGSEWTLVLVNGRPCTAESCSAVMDTGLPVRVTYLSDKWQPVTIVKTPAQIADHIPVRRAWVAGECQNFRFDPHATQFPERQAFISLACEESKLARRELNLKPLPATPDAINMFSEPKSQRPFYKSPWLWAGVGTAIAILVVQGQKKRDDKREPSTTYGLE
jgi:hypothetical protein